jgi:hypothetical protein
MNSVVASDFLTDFTKRVKHTQYMTIELIINLLFEFYHLITIWIDVRYLFQWVLKPVYALNKVSSNNRVDKINESKWVSECELHLVGKLIALQFGYLFCLSKKFVSLVNQVSKAVPP